MKTCRKCRVEKPLSEFYVHKAMLDGHLNFCKACVRSRVTKHRAENLERIQAYDRERGEEHRRLNALQRARKTAEEANQLPGGATGAALVSPEITAAPILENIP